VGLVDRVADLDAVLVGTVDGMVLVS